MFTPQAIPLAKIEEFGVHSNRYYALDLSFFKSSMDTRLLDLLFQRYWINTLSQSSLLPTQDFTVQQVADVAEKVKLAGSEVEVRMVFNLAEFQHK